MNVGIAIFVVGLIADVATIKRIGTPVMGVSILLAVATAATRIRAAMPSASGRGDG